MQAPYTTRNKAKAIKHSLSRCDDLFPLAKVATYVNASLHHDSHIDYAVTSCSDDVIGFEVLDPDINFSDHLPLMATVTVDYPIDNSGHLMPDSGHAYVQRQLRWDYADRASYYDYTGFHLTPILAELNRLTASGDTCNNNPSLRDVIDAIYDDIVSVLQSATSLFVQVHNKDFH